MVSTNLVFQIAIRAHPAPRLPLRLKARQAPLIPGEASQATDPAPPQPGIPPDMGEMKRRDPHGSISAGDGLDTECGRLDPFHRRAMRQKATDAQRPMQSWKKASGATARVRACFSVIAAGSAFQRSPAILRAQITEKGRGVSLAP
jgi:hypothetical protein